MPKPGKLGLHCVELTVLIALKTDFIFFPSPVNSDFLDQGRKSHKLFKVLLINEIQVSC